MDFIFFIHLLNGLLMVAVPVGLAVFLNRRFQLGWRLWWIGAAGFVLSQVGHIPFNWILNRLFQLHVLPTPAKPYDTVIFVIIGGLSAGLWEELTRAAVFHWWADDARSWRKGVWMGAGHGGIEAIILGVLVLYSFINLVHLRSADLTQIAPPAQLPLLQQQVTAYWSAPWTASILGAVERVFTIPCQIALSVIVIQAFIRRQWFWVALAVLWHAVIDTVPIYFKSVWTQAGYSWSVYGTEALIAAAALISIVIIFALRTPEPEAPLIAPIDIIPTPQVGAVSPDDIKDLKVTREHLDDSRYL